MSEQGSESKEQPSFWDGIVHNFQRLTEVPAAAHEAHEAGELFEAWGDVEGVSRTDALWNSMNGMTPLGRLNDGGMDQILKNCAGFGQDIDEAKDFMGGGSALDAVSGLRQGVQAGSEIEHLSQPMEALAGSESLLTGVDEAAEGLGVFRGLGALGVLGGGMEVANGISDLANGEYLPGTLDIGAGGLGIGAGAMSLMGAACPVLGLAAAGAGMMAKGEEYTKSLNWFNDEDTPEDERRGLIEGLADTGWDGGEAVGHVLGDNWAGDAAGAVLGGAGGLVGGAVGAVGDIGAGVVGTVSGIGDYIGSWF